MRRSDTFKRRLAYVIVPVTLLAMVSCAPDEPPTTEATTTPTVPVVQQSSSSPAGTASSADTAETPSVKQYFEIAAKNDPDEWAQAAKLAAPGSPAAAYAVHQSGAQGSEEDAGLSSEPYTLDFDGKVYTTCSDVTDEQTCIKWADFEMQGGKLSNFTVNGKHIEGRLTLGQGDKVRAGKLGSVEFVSAYRTITSESLFVNLVVRSGSRDISIDTYGATYRDPTGRQISAADANGLTDLDKDSNTRVTVVFKKGKPGGVVTLSLSDAKTYDSKKVKLKVG